MREFKELGKDIVKAVYLFVTHRILWLFVMLVVLFYLLLAQLFHLQIVIADSFKRPPPRTTQVTVPIPALRGTIYDSQGRPLAINNLAYVVKLDPSASPAITNDGLYELVKILERNNENYVDSFPITHDEPFAFTFPDNHRREALEFRWKDDMTVENPREATAAEAFDFLRRQFRIDPELSNSEARKILNFRCMLYMQRMIFMDRYNPQPITLAYDVSPATIAAIEENRDILSGVYLEIEALREYPQGIYFSHMLGYIQRINEAELAGNAERGYTPDDLIGKSGLERTYERFLRGEPGSQTIEVDARGRRIGLPVDIVEPEPGNKVFLTIDTHLQQMGYHLLEDTLTEVLINKLTLRNDRETGITVKDILMSLVKSNNLPLKSVMDADEDSDTYVLRQYILERFPEANATERESIEQIKTIIIEGIDANRIAPATVMLALIEAGVLTDDPDGTLAALLRTRPREGVIRNIVVDKMRAKELTPQLINLDPGTGSIVVVDVKNGDVLAAIGYPSFDNNRFVNVFDNDYYTQIFYNDPTNPGLNRPFSEPRAPGSTFKMITAAATLEAGAITPNSRILDGLSFERAGRPFTRCWSSRSHGSIDVATAIAVSCNYFFCESAWRLGNVRNNATLEGIRVLNDYMIYFGLNDKTGVEIGEHLNVFDNNDRLTLRISSPEFKKFQEQSRDPYAPRHEWDWYDGDTVRTAIGQSKNHYTAAMMARYTATIANRGVRYPLHLVQTVTDYQGGIISEYVPVPCELDFEISDRTWDTIIEGMRMVTQTRSGTASQFFEQYPIPVAGKTGTAQESTRRPDHSSFAAFAPIEEPQIAVYVVIPFGSTRFYNYVSVRIAQDMISEVLGLNHEVQYAERTNTLRR
jgi:cell division protein FtsI/penicillin-binding protein 2